MFRWCVYCQKLIGEIEPYNLLEFTHGICSSCLRLKRWSPAAEASVQKLACFHRELLDIGRSGDLSRTQEALDRALALGVRPLDFLMGIIQPSLYEMGSLWERGEITVSEEHRFTAFASRVIDLCYERIPQSRYRQSKHPNLLLINAPNNFHFLGLRLVEQWLIARGHTVYTVIPGVPIEEILQLVYEFKPRFLGISVADMSQVGIFPQLVDALRDTNRFLSYKPKIIGGGPVLRRQEWNPFLPNEILYCKELNLLDSILDFERSYQNKWGGRRN